VRIGGDYFDVVDTDYPLREMGQSTELQVRMTYRLSRAFNWYTRPIAEFLVGNFEEAALRLYAYRAESTRNHNRFTYRTVRVAAGQSTKSGPQ
jgi:hypothetical protein